MPDVFEASNAAKDNLAKVTIDLYEDIKVYDSLPAPIRNMMQNAPFDFPAADVLSDFRRFVANYWWEDVSTVSEYQLAREYATRNMDAFFRAIVNDKSYSRAERYGEYKLTRGFRKVPKQRRAGTYI